MIELGTGTTPADNAASDLIQDVTEATFMKEGIEASQTVAVIVDFWAPWCGPCKTLGPQLEAAVTAAKGAVKMAKVNVDENQGIASQLQIKSLPTVYAFWQVQPLEPSGELVAPLTRCFGKIVGDFLRSDFAHGLAIFANKFV